jgi:hypothetical protein
MLNAQQELVSCKPASQKTGETGCWVIASQPLGVLAKPVYFTMETVGTRELAERKRGPVGTVMEALGEIWLLSVGPKRNSDPESPRSDPGQEYAAQYMKATLQAGMASKTHIHSGIKVFYKKRTGETCVETPEGKQVGKTV